jgi:predicted nucleic acid-binding protein
MPEGMVVSNTSPLLYLHQIKQLDLLRKLYETIIVPTGVEQELLIGAEKGVDVPNLLNLSWINIQTIADKTLLPVVIDLGTGEAEVIALGLTYPGSLLILDDQLGRRIAKVNGLIFTGTLGILIKAKQAGYLPEVAPVLIELQKTNMRLTDTLLRLIIAEADEANNN